MNGTISNPQSSVGAMKIARNVPVSGRYVEWYAPHPGSLSEGAGTPKGRDLSARRRYASEQPP